MADTLPRKLKVFLCHAKEDKIVVRELWDRLIKESWVEPWFDEEHLLPGDDWRLVIQSEVRTADIVIVFLSKKSTTKDGFVHAEVNYALEVANEKQRGAIFIIPILLEDDCHVPYDVRRLHVLDFASVGSKTIAYGKLIGSFRKKIEQLQEQDIVLSKDSFTSLLDQGKEPKPIESISTTPVLAIKKGTSLYMKTQSYGWATCKTPGLLIYIIDISKSMDTLIAGKRKIDLVTVLLEKTFQNIIRQSAKKNKVFPTYKIGVYAYGDEAHNIYAGLKTLDEQSAMGAPQFKTMNQSANTANAFAAVLKLLESELINMQDSPPPLICHITDDKYMGDDPQPYATKIMATRTNIGKTLLQNIGSHPFGCGQEVI